MLEIRNASYSYGGRPAVRDVSLHLHSGALIALAGMNGSGKSTLVKLMARILAPQQGAVLFEGRALDSWDGRELARQIGYLPQDLEMSFPMRAIDVVASGRAPFLPRFRWESDADYAAAEDALATCDARHLAARELDEMSGGERKRVFLARVLAGAPRLMLLDEPFAALDVAHVQQMSSLLRSIVDRSGATVVFAAHDLNWAGAYSDRLIVMKDGAIAADGKPEEILTSETISELFAYDAAVVQSGGRSWLVPRI